MLFCFAGIVTSQSSRQKDRKQERAKPKPKPVSSEEDDDTTSECPEPYGFFADAEQCKCCPI